jgi:SAM-dependent methyltransferase
MSDTYAHVDDGSDPHGAAAWQDRINAWPAIASYKEHSREALRDCIRVLDVGCGTGGDVVALGPGAIGVDVSHTMCAIARERGAVVALAGATALPFAAGVFGGVRVDRVLQHLERPVEALDEVLRVTAPGGRVVVCDPDQATLSIGVPTAPARLLERVTELRREVGLRNGTFVREVPALLRQRRLTNVASAEFVLVLDDPDDAFGLPTWVAYWRSAGPFADADADTWTIAVDAARAERTFRYEVTYVVVTATVPA